MTQEQEKIKMVKLDVTVSPIHSEKIEEEIREEASKGRVVTKSEIIREELDGRYLLKRRKSDK